MGTHSKCVTQVPMPLSRVTSIAAGYHLDDLTILLSLQTSGACEMGGFQHVNFGGHIQTLTRNKTFPWIRIFKMKGIPKPQGHRGKIELVSIFLGKLKCTLSAYANINANDKATESSRLQAVKGSRLCPEGAQSRALVKWAGWWDLLSHPALHAWKYSCSSWKSLSPVSSFHLGVGPSPALL